MNKMLNFIKKYHKNQTADHIGSQEETFEAKDNANPKTHSYEDCKDFLIE